MVDYHLFNLGMDYCVFHRYERNSELWKGDKKNLFNSFKINFKFLRRLFTSHHSFPTSC